MLPLEISIYHKSNDRADVVFRKNKVLHRLGIRKAGAFVTSLGNCLSNLHSGVLLELQGNRMRKWILEMGTIQEERAVLSVLETIGAELRPRFEWRGAAADLERAVKKDS